MVSRLTGVETCDLLCSSRRAREHNPERCLPPPGGRGAAVLRAVWHPATAYYSWSYHSETVNFKLFLKQCYIYPSNTSLYSLAYEEFHF